MVSNLLLLHLRLIKGTEKDKKKNNGNGPPSPPSFSSSPSSSDDSSSNSKSKKKHKKSSFLKLDFNFELPKYDGELNPQKLDKWIKQLEVYCRIHNIVDDFAKL